MNGSAPIPPSRGRFPDLPQTEDRLRLKAKLTAAAYAITVVVLLLVGSMHWLKTDTGMDFGFLAPFHASLNALTALILLRALWHIRRGDMVAHRKAIYAAMVCSALFLLSYVVYHVTMPEVRYLGQGPMRTVYFFLLITHVVLAAAVLPFILFTFIRAYVGEYARHRRMARWVFWLWLYVAISGPICYLMLRPYG